MEVRPPQAARRALNLLVKGGGKKEKKMAPAANKQLLRLPGEKVPARSRERCVRPCAGVLHAQAGKSDGERAVRRRRTQGGKDAGSRRSGRNTGWGRHWRFGFLSLVKFRSHGDEEQRRKATTESKENPRFCM